MRKLKTIQFTKMSGAGNDFIVLEDKKGINFRKLAPKMCDRTNGIGADGLLVLCKSNKYDYKMRIINADNSEAEMCGNGARCLAAYIFKEKKPRKKVIAMDTLAGTILTEKNGDMINVRLNDPKDYKQGIPISVNGQKIRVHYIDTGVPHVIVYVDNLSCIDVVNIGRVIRHHKAFRSRGTNVNFVEQQNASLASVRTYERGVEDETKACGTGSVAAAIVSYLISHPGETDKTNARMNIRTISGEVLRVTFNIKKNIISEVWLFGSARFIAKGEYYI